MPISYQGGHYEFEDLARKIAAAKGWSMERARRYVAGIEHAQKDQGDNRRRNRHA